MPTNYKTVTTPDNEVTVYKESTTFPGNFDNVVSELPANAVPAQIGGRNQLPYVRESKGEFNPAQFGQNLYYSPTFRFSIDFVGLATKAERLAYGINTFNDYAVEASTRDQYSAGQGQAYITESGIHHTLEGAAFYEADLQTYYNMIWSRCPSYGYGQLTFMKYLCLNIETSSDWGRSLYGSGQYWPSWDANKNNQVKCETDGVVRTVEQIANMGDDWWRVETQIRRANRYRLCILTIKDKSHPDCKITLGASPYQGRPRVDFENRGDVFADGFCRVQHIGGDSQGNITLNNPDGGTRTYKLSGSHWDVEDFLMGYYYLFNFDISSAVYNRFWIQKNSADMNYPALWANINTIHIVADEKGYIQMNRKKMIDRQGKYRPFWRMMEPMYEGDGGFVDGAYPATAHTVPFPDMQNPGGYETPKVWQSPYMTYSRYAVTRFFAGNEQDWGFYVFPTSPQFTRGDFKTMPLYNHHLHTYTAIFHARADMQPLEAYYTGSILVEDPEVQLNGSGGFSAYNGVAAYNYADGKQSEQKPAYMLRHKDVGTGWQVYVLGGMNQAWTAERTDVVRVPNGALGGNMFQVKLRGPGVHLYEFFVPKDKSGQTFTASFNATSFEQPGYCSRIQS